MRLRVGSVLALLSVTAIAAPPLGSAPAPHIALAKPETELKCRSRVIGVSSTVARENFPAFGVCLMSTTCEVVAPFTIRFEDRDVLWSKEDTFTHTFSCKVAEGGSCPEPKACAEASSKDRLHSWTKAAAYPTSTRAPGDGKSCKYASAVEPRMIVRQAKVESKWVRDAVCASTVSCDDPKVTDEVAVCKARTANYDTLDVQCPSAMDCVAERYPLERPKVEVAARPHGGTPAQTVSMPGSGSNHSTGDQNRR